MEIYVHRSGAQRIELREVEETVSVVEATGAEEDEEIWIEDVEESIDVTMTLKDAEIDHRCHVHVNKCHRVEVSVRFNGETKGKGFAPSTTIKRLTNWVTGEKGFDLSKEDKVEHVLQICNSTDQPEESDHVGSLVAKGDCEVCLDLVPKHKFEG